MNEGSNAETLGRHEKLSVGRSDDVERDEKHLVGSRDEQGDVKVNKSGTGEHCLGVEKDLQKVAARTCYICPPREFEDVEQLLEHLVNKHAGKVDYKCQQCPGKELKTIQCYNAHLKLHDSSYTQQHKSQRTAVQCKICFKVFSHENNLREHVRTHTGEHPHKCDKCGRQFTKKIRLNKHIHNIHEKDSSQGPEKCALCSISGLSIVSLQVHIYEHHPSQDYPYTECPLCPKKFLNSKQMQNHKYNHNRPAKLLCTSCGEQQRTRSQLELHMTNVHGKYVCILCTGRFKTHTDLEIHLLHQVCLEE